MAGVIEIVDASGSASPGGRGPLDAFAAMRKRGVSIADIAILVVAADDGVRPQTKEVITYLKERGLPVIVAINKIDKPEAKPERVKQELAEHGIILITIILGVVFWLVVISIIALVMVADRIIEEVISGRDDDMDTPREERDEQGDPEEYK